MLSATSVLPTAGNGNAQKGLWSSADLRSSTAERGEVLIGGLQETVLRVHHAPHPTGLEHQKK